MRHINCIENIDNLRALIKQDLRELGIKLPKGKKLKKQSQYTKQHAQQENAESNGVFENLLAQVACVHIPNCGYVPRFLVDAAEIIKKNIDQEGLFRKSGAVSRIKELKEKIEKGEDLGSANIVDVTVLIKQFFKSLPEPLFTSTYHDAFIRCIQLPNKDDAYRALLLLCLLLPGEHISTIRYMMSLLKLISEHSDKNKMDATNLSVVLAPNFLYLNSKSEKMNSVEEKLLQFQTSVVEVLIRNAEEIGFISDSLYERTLLMTEVFGTDDELDASCEGLEESRDCKKKEKKRKRTGSFTGIVSTIAQSITKWRRSTDGKTNNVSNMSQASNISDYSHVSTKCNKSTAVHEDPQPVDLSAATPVVMRKRKASGDVVAFSTSKKKAILQNLPQGSALRNTPFTPATALRNMDIKKGSLDTPSIAFSNRAQVAFSATPSTNGKGSRKRLNLFSPGSMRKNKKNASGSNISAHNALKKGKPAGKGLFRRLSGGKGDKVESEFPQSEQDQVGLRLASPKCTPPSSEESDEPNEQGSPLPVILNQSNSSLPPTEQSIMSVCDDRNSLNDGFIIDEDLEMSQNDVSQIRRDEPRHCLSDTAIMYANDSTYNTSLSRSMSLDAQKIRLRRGQPNSVKTGLLHGEKENVRKLRRSFGLDKSEIGEPVALLIPDLPQMHNAKDVHSNGECLEKEGNQQIKNKNECEGSVSMESTCESTGLLDKKPTEQPENCDSNVYVTDTDNKEVNTQIKSDQLDSISLKPKIQNSTSTDSLLVGQEDAFNKLEKKTIARTLSTDSGKGSMFDVSEVGETIGSTSPSSQKKATEGTKNPIKHNSEQDLKKPLRAFVSRSQSLCEQPKKAIPKITPNLQISMETHKLLSRAGYLASKTTASEDVMVMGPPPAKIKQAETVISKHESIMELQTQQRGRVASTARQFDTDHKDVAERHTSPYRFPNSTSRKRGVSPIRIPTIFAKSDEEAAKMKDLVTVTQKSGKGQAKLPISTLLLKPTEDVAAPSNSVSVPIGSKLKRKPSIYYTADHSRLNESSMLLEKVAEDESMDIDVFEPIVQSDKENKDSHFSESLQTNDVYTEILGNEKMEHKDGMIDSENLTPSNPSKVPTIKMPLATPLAEMVVLRTASGMTPRHVIKKTRSPIKPVKRLRSPGSPCRNSPRKHSPRTNKHLLSSIPCHLQEEMSPL
ncbi:rho GTPase-activating protein 11A-like isoform X2 [Mytilus edulis]|uniref:rho GTPase-activating protein 11A-like isoform X2 n=1 Tax=Mytilus edulis TaxID=6550 RepID=UPI0039EFE7FF